MAAGESEIKAEKKKKIKTEEKEKKKGKKRVKRTRVLNQRKSRSVQPYQKIPTTLQRWPIPDSTQTQDKKPRPIAMLAHFGTPSSSPSSMLPSALICLCATSGLHSALHHLHHRSGRLVLAGVEKSLWVPPARDKRRKRKPKRRWEWGGEGSFKVGNGLPYSSSITLQLYTRLIQQR